jgi:hypothetical protein
MSDLTQQIQRAQVLAGEQAVIDNLIAKGLIKAESKPRAIEVGRLTSIDPNGDLYTTQFGLLISFESAAQLRQALAQGTVNFSFLDEDTNANPEATS